MLGRNRTGRLRLASRREYGPLNRWGAAAAAAAAVAAAAAAGRGRCSNNSSGCFRGSSSSSSNGCALGTVIVDGRAMMTGRLLPSRYRGWQVDRRESFPVSRAFSAREGPVSLGERDLADQRTAAAAATAVAAAAAAAGAGRDKLDSAYKAHLTQPVRRHEAVGSGWPFSPVDIAAVRHALAVDACRSSSSAAAAAVAAAAAAAAAAVAATTPATYVRVCACTDRSIRKCAMADSKDGQYQMYTHSPTHPFPISPSTSRCSYPAPPQVTAANSEKRSVGMCYSSPVRRCASVIESVWRVAAFNLDLRFKNNRFRTIERPGNIVAGIKASSTCIAPYQ